MFDINHGTAPQYMSKLVLALWRHPSIRWPVGASARKKFIISGPEIVISGPEIINFTRALAPTGHRIRLRSNMGGNFVVSRTRLHVTDKAFSLPGHVHGMHCRLTWNWSHRVPASARSSSLTFPSLTWSSLLLVFSMFLLVFSSTDWHRIVQRHRAAVMGVLCFHDDDDDEGQKVTKLVGTSCNSSHTSVTDDRIDFWWMARFSCVHNVVYKTVRQGH